MYLGKKNPLKSYLKAIGWIKSNTIKNEGIKVTSTQNSPAYPEVTGYFIPTLLQWGEKELALQYGNWLKSIQNNDGSWCAPNSNIPYTFDVGQILKGLISLDDICPDYKANIISGCNWIVKNITPDGRLTTPDTSAWGLPGGKMVPEAIHLYALEPLILAGKKYNIPMFCEMVEKVVNYYLYDTNLTEFNTLSHFHAYIVEALIDLGHRNIAKKAMDEVFNLMKKDGSIPAYKDVKWICSTGLFQYSVIWYKLQEYEKANLAFTAGIKLQNRSGGFYGSYGFGATYFKREEISWCNKYFLDALFLKIKNDFNHNVNIYSNTISNKDGRYIIIDQEIKDMLPNTIVDLGCGKGRYLYNIKQQYPSIELFGMDISDEMLKCLPKDIVPILGSLLNIPIENESMDLAFCVEALEHAVNIRKAIEEIYRILKHGGRVIIIDKNVKLINSHSISEWEQWFSAEKVVDVLRQVGFSEIKTYSSITYDDNNDNLFIGWVATK